MAKAAYLARWRLYTHPLILQFFPYLQKTASQLVSSISLLSPLIPTYPHTHSIRLPHPLLTQPLYLLPIPTPTAPATAYPIPATLAPTKNTPYKLTSTNHITSQPTLSPSPSTVFLEPMSQCPIPFRSALSVSLGDGMGCVAL